MAYDEGVTFTRGTGVAYADLSTSQFYAVKLTANGMELATAAKAIDGILQDNPLAGKAGCYASDGVTKAAISASQTLSVGALLQVDSGSTLCASSGGVIVAKALEAVTSVATVSIIAVEILRNAPAGTAFA